MRCENKKNHYIIIILASIVVLRVSEIHRLSSVDCRVTLLFCSVKKVLRGCFASKFQKFTYL